MTFVLNLLKGVFKTKVIFAMHVIKQLSFLVVLIFQNNFSLGQVPTYHSRLFDTLHSVTSSDDISCTFYSSDGSHGWLCGDYGRIEYTIDGGRSWHRPLRSFVSSYLQRIWFCPDNKNGWICGPLGLIYSTSDGGLTWSKVHQKKTTARLYDIWFSPDNKVGVCAGEGGVIIWTSDGGRTWHNKDFKYSENIIRIIPIPNNTNGVILITNERSPTYLSTQDFNIPLKYLISESEDLKCDNNAAYCGYASSNNNFMIGLQEGYIAESKDGLTWSMKHVMGKKNEIHSIYFVDWKTGYCSGDSNIIYKTNDGGVNWSAYKVIEGAVDIRELWSNGPELRCVANGGIQYIIKGDSVICTSAKHQRYNLFDVVQNKDSFYGIGTPVSTKKAGIFLKFSGRTEANQQVNEDGIDLLSIFYCPTGNLIYVGGEKGQVFRSSNSGKGWVKVSLPDASRKIYGLYFNSSGNTGFCITDSSYIYKTKDFGRNWYCDKNYVSEYDLRGITFSDADLKTGFIVGEDGLYLTTTNGGVSWDLSNLYDSYFDFDKIFLSRDGKNKYVIANYQTVGIVREVHNAILISHNGSPFREVLKHSKTFSNLSLQDSIIWATTTNGEAFVSIDQGDNWFQIVPGISAYRLNKIAKTTTDFEIFGDKGFHVAINNNFVLPTVKALDLTSSGSFIRPKIIFANNTSKTDLDKYFVELQVNPGDSKFDGLTRFFYAKNDPDPWPDQNLVKDHKYLFVVTISNGLVTKKFKIYSYFGQTPWFRFKKFMGWNKLPSTPVELGKTVGTNSTLAIIIYFLVVFILFLFYPLKFIIWHEQIAAANLPFQEKATKILSFFLIGNNRILDVYVRHNKELFLTKFLKHADVKNRIRWIPSPLIINLTEVRFNPENSIDGKIYGLDDIKSYVQYGRNTISIEGQGGIGKSTLAFQIARWASGENPSQKLFNHQMLPLFVNKLDRNIDTICLDKVETITGNKLSPALGTALLRKHRIIAIVDGISEMKNVNNDWIDIEKGAKDLQHVVFTSRKPIPFEDKLLITPKGIKLEYLDSLIDGFTILYAGAFKFGEQREVLRKKIRAILLAFNHNDNTKEIPLTVLKFIIEHASKLIDSGQELSGNLPDTLPQLYDDYLREIFKAELESSESMVINLVNCAMVTMGLDQLNDYESLDTPKENFCNPQWQPIKKYEDLSNAQMVAFYIQNGILIETGSIGFKLAKFNYDSLAEYLASKHLFNLSNQRLINKKILAIILETSQKVNIQFYQLMFNYFFPN
jgi:photosystem II stability/assembly factor-like uncharacterized protein